MMESRNLREAKFKFSRLFKSLEDTRDVEAFRAFVFEELITSAKENKKKNGSVETLSKNKSYEDDPIKLLDDISEDIKQMIPDKGIFSSETIIFPERGENSDCLPHTIAHLDDFLYNEDDVETLLEEGKIQSHYCKKCKSRDVEPLIFISHSMSKEALYYIFSRLVKLDDKLVLDVGSRLGAVLYGAYAYSSAKQIVGVEMNDDLCQLQNNIIDKYKLGERVRVVNDRLENNAQLVQSCDVIILNNAFEFYLPPAEQVAAWRFVKDNLKSGAILVTRPHLVTTFRDIDTGIDIGAWVKPYRNSCHMDDESRVLYQAFCDLAFYQVL